MAPRLNIYAGQPMQAALDALGAAYADNKSGRLNMVCERFLAMVADELRRLDLSRAEWCAVLDANNGVEVATGIPSSSTMIWANVHDTPGLGDKWGVDQSALVRRLQALPQSSLLAIQEAADRFWSHSEMRTDEAMKTAGVKPGNGSSL